MTDTSKVAVALIKNKEGEYFLVRLADYYPSYQLHKDEWCPIAGHIKEGETVEQTIIREIKEELGVNAKPIRQIAEWVQDIPGESSLWWEVEIEGPVKPNEKIAEYGYFSKDEAKNIKLWPATKSFFEKFIWK